MTETTRYILPRVRTALCKSLGPLVILLGLVVAARAQGGAEGITPPALAPGLPAGSYALGGFESVNLFNGNLNFHLPLLNVGGRGDAQIPMMLKIEQRWRVVREAGCASCGPIAYPTYNWWTGFKPGYGPGIMEGRMAIWGQQEDLNSNIYPEFSLLRFTFTGPDGTEYEFRDATSEGQPKPVFLQQPFGPAQYFLRGTTFVTKDGASATFISCAPNGTLIPISDSDEAGVPIYPSGLMLLRDGTRYRIDAGLVSWMQDRNGNRLTFFYESRDQFNSPDGRVTRIVDSLNRQITVAYDVNAGAPYGICDEIRFQGFAGVARKIRVSRDLMSNVLRSPFDIRSVNELFPGLAGSQHTPFDGTVTSAVWLPDGRSYKFYYNDYGELSRVVLPTGGAIEYDWNAGAFNSGVGGSIGDRYIYRRIVERRVYPDGSTGPSYQTKSTYSRPETFQGTNLGFVEVKQFGASPTPLAVSRHFFNGSAFSNPNDEAVASSQIDYFPWDSGREHKTEARDTNATTILQAVEHTFVQQSPPWWNAHIQATGCLSCVPPSNDTHLTETRTKLTDVTPNLVARQTYGYDIYNNKTSVEEFDYGALAPPSSPRRRTQIDYVTTGEINGIDYTGTNISSNITLPYLRSLPKEQRVYAVSSSGTATLQAKTHFLYDEFSLVNRAGIVGMGPGDSTSFVPRGNLTSTQSWLDTTDEMITTTTQKYDIAGNITEITDALGSTSQIDFASSLNTYAFPTTLRTPVPDPTGEQGSDARLETIVDYDFNSGLVKSITDPNGHETLASYDDDLDRLTNVERPSGGGQTSYFYGDTIGNLFLRTQTQQTVDQDVESFQYFDGLGRSAKSSLSEGATSILTETRYDALGRVSQVSNPYRAGATVYWALTEYDALGRVFRVTNPGGAQATSIYSGNSVTVTDPAAKTRKTVSDGLGRLTQVVEDPGSAPHLNYQTNYTYDALENLRKVVQGSQLRYFAYDSLKRLIRARNPEHDVNASLPALTDAVTANDQWSCAYSYDNNSNLQAKTDPRNITCNYTYDAMSRVTTRSYEDDPTQTPFVGYKYDGVGATIPNALGKLTSVSTSGSLVSNYTYDNFDAMGRVLHSTQTTDGQPYGIGYQYDLAGNLISETYPSGRVVSTGYDAAGRINDVSSGPTHYASAFTYAAHGGVTDLKLGNNLWEHTTFDPNRLQPTEIYLGSTQGGFNKLKLNYTYGPLTTNNGNVVSQTITIPSGPTLTQSYTYDGVNRLLVAQENTGASWKQTFTYDQFGNRRIDASNTTPALVGPNPQISSATNRISSTGYSFDFAGNLTVDATGHTYDYDAENKQVKYDLTTGRYFYDGDGRRVKKIDGGGITVFVYNASGQLIAEYHNDPVPPPAGGGGVSYLTTDHLGSTRVVTKSDGTVKARYDYLPFGEELGVPVGGRTVGMSYGGADSTKQKFTQKERDNESGLDYFGTRYYSSAQGRFTSVDAGGFKKRHLINPQKWNRYAYTINNPLKYFDPDGLEELIVYVRSFIPQSSKWGYAGDNRNPGDKGTYRTEQRIVIETDPSKNKGQPLVQHTPKTGISIGPEIHPGNLGSTIAPVVTPGVDQASGKSLKAGATQDNTATVNIHATGNEGDPLLKGLAPGITYNLDIRVQSQGPQGDATVTVTGEHDRFPGYEVMVERPEAQNSLPTVVHQFDPRVNGNSPASLLPLAPNEKVNTTTVIPPRKKPEDQ